MILAIDVFNDVSKLIKKDGLSGYFNLDTFNKWCPTVENTLMSYYCKDLEKSSEISDSLRPFTKEAELFLVNGIATVPSDYRHFAQVGYRFYANAETCGGTPTDKPISVDFCRMNEWFDMMNSPIRKPNLLKSKVRFRIINNQLQLSEKTGSIYLDYIKNPIHPVFTYNINTTTDETEPTNNPSFEWLEQDRSNLIDLFCMSLGMSIRETTLIQWAQMPKINK